MAGAAPAAVMGPDDFGRLKLERYKLVRKLGSGASATVYEHVDTESGDVVAVKKILLVGHKEGVNMAAIREIQLMQELSHPNVLRLVDVFAFKKQLHLVLEFCPTSLEDIIKDTSLTLSIADVKAFMKMALVGLAHVHSSWVIHRDLKPGNLLVGSDHQVKVADFGLGREFGSPNRHLHHGVVTMFYRAPELLMGANDYGSAVDMWSMGCIMAELLTRHIVFVGDNFGSPGSEIQQLAAIYGILGTPTAEEWPGMSKLPGYVEFREERSSSLSDVFVGAPADALDLLGKLLAFNPEQRLSAADALAHPFFSNAPAPTPAEDLPIPRKAAEEIARARAARAPPSGDAAGGDAGGAGGDADGGRAGTGADLLIGLSGPLASAVHDADME